MAGGSAVNLVSRCSSLDEFVAAFRGYVHRDHVFVPTTGQLTAGRRGRIAITLADGTPVLAGEAEVLSSSVVPQGPYQKPGIRLRFAELDAASQPVLSRLERARSEPGAVLADALGATTGARADIRALDGASRDATEPAMCTVVETGAPAQPLAVGGALPRVDRKPAPARPSAPALGGVPGKSFKIPSIPSIPARPGGGAAPVPRDVSGPASGDYTVPTDPAFEEPSSPVETPAVAAVPTASATPPTGPTPGGKARNRTMLGNVRGRPAPATESAPHIAPIAAPPAADEALATTRMPPLFGEDDGASATPPAPADARGAAGSGATPATPAASLAAAAAAASIGPPPGRAFARTLMGMPTIAQPPKPAPAPARASLTDDDGWTMPEEGQVGDATERSVAPVDSGVDVDFTDDEPPAREPAVAPARNGAGTPAAPILDDELPTRPPDGVERASPDQMEAAFAAAADPVAPAAAEVPRAPAVAPAWQAVGKGVQSLKAGPSAPTVRTPQSLLELGQAVKQTPLPGMPPLPGMSPLPGTTPVVAPPSAAPHGAPPIPGGPPAMPGAATPTPTPPPHVVTAVPAPMTPRVPRREELEATELVPRLDPDVTDHVSARGRARRPVVIGAVAAAVIAAGVALGLVLAGGGDDAPAPAAPAAESEARAVGDPPAPAPAEDPAPPVADPAPPADPPAAAVAAPADDEPADPEAEPAAVAAIDPDDGADPEDPEEPEPEPAPEPAPPAEGACQVAFSSTPSGASVVIGGKKRGKTPVTLDVACGKGTATFARARYRDEKKAFTARAGARTKVAARLDRPTFTIKVTSQPSGASVSVNGKSVGKTPVRTKVTGFQAVSVKVSKPGFQSKTTKVTAKRNNTAVKVSLRRGN